MKYQRKTGKISRNLSGGAFAKGIKKKKEDIEAYRHETDKRKNAVPVGLTSYDTANPKPKKYGIGEVL